MSYTANNNNNQFNSIVAGDGYFNRLFINNVRFRDYVAELVQNIQLEQAEIDEIQAFLARLDISGLSGNLVLTDANRNAVLKTAIDGILTKLLYLDTTALTQSWVITDANRNATLLTTITSQGGDISALQTKTQYITSSANTITINTETINIGQYNALVPSTATNLRGDIYTNQAYFKSLNTSSIFGWNDFITLINASNLPSYVASAAITVATSFMPSDVLTMAGSISKSGNIETTNTIKCNEFVLFNTSVLGVDILSKFLVFLAKGNCSFSTILGNVAMQTFSGHIFMRNNNISATTIDWAVTEARDKCNIVSIQNNDILIHLGAAQAGGDIEVINSCGGDIVFKNGTNGLKSGTTSVMKIKYNANFLDQIEMGLIDPNLNWATNNSKLFVVQLYNQTNGITVGSPDVFPATNHKFSHLNSTNVNTGALILQDNYQGSQNKALYTTENGSKLFYSGTQLYPVLPTATYGGIGITYILNNTTNANAPQTISMSEVYVSQPSRSITLSNYNANTEYLLTTAIGVIPKDPNPIVSGTMQHDQFLTYTANQTGQIYDKVYFRATSSQNVVYDHPTEGNTNYNNVLRYIYPKTNTTEINVNNQSVYTAFIPVSNNSATLTLHSVTITRVALSNTGGINNFVRLELVNAIGGVIYTFTDVAYSNGIAQTITFGGSLTTINISNTTAVRFKFTNLGTTNPSIIQTALTGAQGVNGLMYIIHGSPNQVYTTLLYDGTSNKTNLVNNATDDYILTLPITTLDITQLYEPNLQVETYFIQPTGTTSNHSIALLYGDGYLSHIDSTFSSVQSTPNIQQVLQQGTNAAGLNITNLGTISPSAITNWNVKEITAGTGISRTITSGSYAIANTAPVQNAQAGTNIGVSIASNTATISNTAPVQNITAGSGISVSVANNNATITNTGITSVVAGNGLVVETVGGVSTISQSIFAALGSLNDPAITETTLRPNKLPQYYGQRWKEQTQIPQATYYDVFVSKDGATIAVVGSTAISGGETIKVSHDYGATFDNALNTSPAYVYNAICGSSTGYIMYAISTNPKKIVKSTDFGFTFTALADPFNLDFPNSAPAGISCSSDGKFVMISDARANGFGKVYTSGDFGANWNTYNIVNATAYSGISCMSANGQVRYIILQTNNNLSLAGVYRTNNYGSNWEKRLSKVNANDTEYGDICCDGTGRIVVVTRVFGSNLLYTMVSQDYGSNWFSTGISDIYSVTISPNSSIIWAGAHNGKIYYSNDQGWSFKLLDNLVGSTPHANIASNGDGSVVFSTFYGNSTTRPYAFTTHPIEDIAQKHYFSFTQNLLQASGSTTFYNLPNDMDLQNFEYYLTIDIDKVWFNKYIYLGLNGSQNIAHQYNAIYYSSSSTNSPQTLSNTQFNTLTSGANQIYQASDSGNFPIWYSPNAGTFYYASSSLVFRMYSPKKDQIILEKQGHTHYRTYNISGNDGKGTGNSLANGIGIDYPTIRGQIDITTAKIYLETNTKWAPSSIQFFYTSDTNVAGNATVKISDITRKAKNKILY